jgi:hypothetical protein
MSMVSLQILMLTTFGIHFRDLATPFCITTFQCSRHPALRVNNEDLSKHLADVKKWYPDH